MSKPHNQQAFLDALGELMFQHGVGEISASADGHSVKVVEPVADPRDPTRFKYQFSMLYITWFEPVTTKVGTA